jgi:hypothetical protein
MLHPTTFRLYKSNTTAKYNQPSPVGIYVKSQTHFRFGASAVKSRFNTFAAGGWSCRESVVHGTNRRCRFDRNPVSRISRATVFTLIASPCSRNSRCTRGEP